MRHLSLKALALVGGLALTGTTSVLATQGGALDNAPVRLEVTDDGPVFVTPSGMTLYVFGADDSTPGKSQCTSTVVRDMRDPTAGLGKFPLAGYQYLKSCADMWPAFMADANARPSGEWTLIDRPEGKQWAYRGRPLYRSIKDKKTGERNGVMGGGEFFGGRRGWGLAGPPLGLPPGLKLSREGETVVLATANGRPVYSPRRGKRVIEASSRTESLFQPIPAALVVTVGGDWTVLQASAGVRQFAFKGRALYAAPESLTNDEIEASGNWEKVVYRKMAPRPSEIETRFTIGGDVYTDKNGRTLYMHNCSPTGCDLPGGPAAIWAAFCGSGEECAKRWQPYRASTNSKPSGEWSIVEVPTIMFKDPAGTTYPPDVPRVKAWAYRGRPVYTYYEDKEPGDVWGNQIRWFGIGSFSAVSVPGRSIYE